MDRACAAQRTTATELGAGHAEDVAHHPQHRRVVVDIDAVCLPIDCDGEGHDGLSLSANDTRNADGIRPEGRRRVYWTMVSVGTSGSVGAAIVYEVLGPDTKV